MIGEHAKGFLVEGIVVLVAVQGMVGEDEGGVPVAFEAFKFTADKMAVFG